MEPTVKALFSPVKHEF